MSYSKTHTQNQSVHSTEATDTLPMAEALSAWIDGEALPDSIQHDAVLQWLLQDDGAYQKWRQWQAAAAFAQTAEATVQALPASSGQPAVGSTEWTQQLQQRLATIDTENSTLLQHTTPAFATTTTVVPTTTAAANDSFWNRKIAVGFASLTVAAWVGWSLQAQQPTSCPTNGQLTAHNATATATAPQTQSNQVATAPSALSAENDDQTDVLLSPYAYAESLMLVHTQLGELSETDAAETGNLL